MRRALVPALMAVALAATVLVITLHHAGRPQPLAQRVQAVAATLRCPTCVAQSAASSDAPIAKGMRNQIRQQLRAGRSPDQVRQWFVARYGDGIVLLPADQGPGAAVWAAPVAALALGSLALALALHRRRRGPSQNPRRISPMRAAPVGAVLLSCGVVGLAVPLALTHQGSGQQQAATTASRTAPTTPAQRARLLQSAARSLDRGGHRAAAIRAYRRALHYAPHDADLATVLGFDLVRSGHAAAAQRVVAPFTHRARHQPMSLVVLGLAQRARHEQGWRSTLERFVRLAPHQPATRQVRRILGGSR